MPTICLTAQKFPPDLGDVGVSAQRITLLLQALSYRVQVAAFRSVFRQQRKLAKSEKFSRSVMKLQSKMALPYIVCILRCESLRHCFAERDYFYI